MREILVNFKTSILAKEKGFNENCQSKYICLPFSIENPCYNPSQSLLQKWLREKYKIDIQIFGSIGNYNVRSFIEKDDFLGIYKYGFKIYEEALEHGLQEALKLIK